MSNTEVTRWPVRFSVAWLDGQWPCRKSQTLGKNRRQETPFHMSDRGTLRYPSKRAATCTGLKLKEGHESETSGVHIQGVLQGHVTYAVT